MRRAAIMAFVGSVLLAGGARAQLLEVRQDIYGMD